MACEWYYAKCDRCMETAHVMVKSPYHTLRFLSNARVFYFLQRHLGCELTLVWRDDQMDKLWEAGYNNSDLRETTLTHDEDNDDAIYELAKHIFEDKTLLAKVKAYEECKKLERYKENQISWREFRNNITNFDNSNDISQSGIAKSLFEQEIQINLARGMGKVTD